MKIPLRTYFKYDVLVFFWSKKNSILIIDQYYNFKRLFCWQAYIILISSAVYFRVRLDFESNIACLMPKDTNISTKNMNVWIGKYRDYT